MKTVLMAALTLMLIPSIALAGAGNGNNGNGGGTKGNGTVTVTNDGDEPLGVALNPSSSFRNRINNGQITGTSDFESRGGRILEPGESTTFNTRTGTQSLTTAFFNGTTSPNSTTVSTNNITVNRGQTSNVSVTGDSSGRPTTTTGN